MVRIKICGLTTPADAVLAAKLGADALGLNFYSRSSRHITESQAAEIMRVLPAFVDPVGIYVTEHFERAQHAALALGMRTTQIYGKHESAPPAPRVRIIPAFPVKDEASLNKITTYLGLLRAA